jgi:hypothetical protein
MGPKPEERKGRLESRPFLASNFSRTGVSAPHYFLGAIASFAALATRNFTTVFALI